MRNARRNLAALAFALLCAARPAFGQQSSGTAQTRAQQPASAGTTQDAAQPKPGKDPPRVEQRFWNRGNDFWFAAVAASRALDFASTMNIRRRGINEAFLTNSVVDNHALFATIEAGATGASIGVSYIFYRTHHHKLERWTSIIHFGIATGGAIRNYALKTPHPTATTP